jgi:hypothetical protein
MLAQKPEQLCVHSTQIEIDFQKLLKKQKARRVIGGLLHLLALENWAAHMECAFKKMRSDRTRSKVESFERLPRIPVRGSEAWATSPAHLHRIVCHYV